MIDGNIKGIASYGTGAVIAIIAIVIVFIVLLLIIFLTDLVSKTISNDKEETKALSPAINGGVKALPLDVNDEDALVACLVASIDYRNVTKKNIQVVSVKEVK